MSLPDYFLSLGTRLAPYLFLILIPFRNHLRCSFRQSVLYAFLLYLGTTLSVYLLGETYGIDSIWMFLPWGLSLSGLSHPAHVDAQAPVSDLVD